MHAHRSNDPGRRRRRPGAAYRLRPEPRLSPNTEYVVEGRGTFVTDASGKVVHVQTTSGVKGSWNPDLNRPVPNAIYVVDQRYVFQTDHLGRTQHIHAAELGYNTRVDTSDRRHTYPQSRAGHEGGDGYEGAHGIGTNLLGPGERINLTPGLREVNRGVAIPSPGSRRGGVAC